MDKLNLNKGNLKKFGITMGVAFLVITIVILFKRRHSIIPTSVISAIFFISGLAAPILLKPVYIFWMRLAFVLAWINTRIILFVLFYLIFSPMGLVMRLFRVDLLDRRLGKLKDSYWLKKEKKEFNPQDYERQF